MKLSQELCDQAELEGAVFILRDLLQLPVLFASADTSGLWDPCSLNAHLTRCPGPTESYAAGGSLNPVA